MRAALFLLALLPSAAGAQDLADTHFGLSFCYAQSFEAAHLREHPEQKVRSIRLGREPIGSMTMLGVLSMELRVRLRDGDELRTVADCRPDGDGLRCRLGRGEGGFALEAEGREIRLTVSEGGLALTDWAKRETRLESDEGDDKEFLLSRCG